MSPHAQKLRRALPHLAVILYALLIIKLAVDTWPKAGMGGGLEFMLNLFAAAPLSFVFAAILWGLRPLLPADAHFFLVMDALAGLVQAMLVWLLLRRLGRRRSK